MEASDLLAVPRGKKEEEYKKRSEGADTSIEYWAESQEKAKPPHRGFHLRAFCVGKAKNRLYTSSLFSDQQVRMRLFIESVP